MFVCACAYPCHVFAKMENVQLDSEYIIYYMTEIMICNRNSDRLFYLMETL